jgi:hypothetical protein
MMSLIDFLDVIELSFVSRKQPHYNSYLPVLSFRLVVVFITAGTKKLIGLHLCHEKVD